jgi:hypothetical protein
VANPQWLLVAVAGFRSLSDSNQKQYADVSSGGELAACSWRGQLTAVNRLQVPTLFLQPVGEAIDSVFEE